MTGQDLSTKQRRWLRYLGYANLGLGLLSLVGWALPGPYTIRTFWTILDGMGSSSGEPVVAIVVGVMKTGVVLVVALFWATSFVSIANGYLILRRRRYRMCLVLSGLSVLGTLFGILLGTVSIMILIQEWARDQFPDGTRPTAGIVIARQDTVEHDG